MKYVHAGIRDMGEVQSTGGDYSGPPDASVPGVNPHTQPTEGMSTGDRTSDEAIGMVRGKAMGMTTPSGVAGSSVSGPNYTHVGMRQPGEVTGR